MMGRCTDILQAIPVTCSTVAFVHMTRVFRTDWISVPSSQTSIDAGQRSEHLPLASLDSGGPIEYLLPGLVDANLEPANTYLFERAMVTKGNGPNLDAEPVGPVNNDTLLFDLFDKHFVAPSSKRR